MAFLGNQAKKVGAGTTYNYLASVVSKVGTKISNAVNTNEKSTDEAKQNDDFEEVIVEDEDLGIDYTTAGDQVAIHTSMMPYHSARQSLQRFGVKNNLQKPYGPLYMAKECAYLSNWIYYIDREIIGFDDYDYRKMVKSNKSTQVAQWLFLYSEKRKTGFLVFKGTDVDNPQDILTDLGIIPYPIYPKKGEKEISGHALMEAAITRDYDTIKEEILSKDIEHLYLTGHSLGGGLAIMFGLKGIIDNLIPLKVKSPKSVKIITFGAPSVIAIEKEMDKLSMKAKHYLDTLHDITECFVNAFDIVPRLLSTAGVKWMDFISKATYKYVENWRTKIMTQAQDKVHEYVLRQNMPKEQQGCASYVANQVKADVIGVVGQSAISLVKTIGDTVQKGANLVKGDDVSLAVSLKIIEFTEDEYKMEEKDQEEDQTQNVNADTFTSFQGVIESIKKSAKGNLKLYHTYGTYHFCMNESELEGLITDNQDSSEQMLSYIPSRLAFSTENMQMLIYNHSMSEYLKLFEEDSKSKVSITGYLDGILKQIQDGEPCGGGDMWWLIHDKKYTPIGKIVIEQHMGDGNEWIKGIREKAFWSKHSKNWRLRFNVWGYANSNIEVAVADTYPELKAIFDKY